MADEDDDAVWGMLEEGTTIAPSRPSCPPRGRDREFDQYCDSVLDDVRPGDDIYDELRKATWLTWKTKPPTGLSAPVASTEEDDLARAIALSQQDIQAGTSSARQDPTRNGGNDEAEEEQLRKALLLSQKEARAPKRARREETPEDERKELERALQASLITHNGEDEEEIRGNEDLRPRHPSRLDQTVPRSSEQTPRSPPAVSITPISPRPAILNDRAAMEKERLERQAARQAKGVQTGKLYNVIKMPPPPTSRPSGSGGVTTLADLGNQPSSSSSAPRPPRKTAHPLQSAGPFPSDTAGEYYLDGEMRHTALVIGEETQEPTFAPGDVMGRTSQIALLIVSSFVIDDEWASTVLPDPAVVPTVMIRPHPKSEPTWNGKVQAQVDHEVRCYPKMIGEYGSAHMKFAWVFYKTGRLRVAIMTANMVPYDWEWIENTIFVQDFLPIRPPTDPLPNPKAKDFAHRFRHLFVHLKVHKALRYLHDQHPNRGKIPFKVGEEFEDINKWDWSRVKVRLVLSIPDTYEGVTKMKDFGLCRIGSVLEEEGWVPAKGEIVKAEYQGSSLGQYSLDWFDAFYQNCSGKNLQSLIIRPKPKAHAPIKVIFPSDATVAGSILGKEGGGTMFCSKAMNSVTRPLFHDANSKRGGVLMHAKVLIGMFETRPDNLGFGVAQSTSNGKRKHGELEDKRNEEVGGWAYVGSHNFSGAAWGTLSLKKSPPSLNIRNYELGVLFPLPRRNAREAADAVAPYKRPPRQYSARDVPWDQSTHVAANPGAGH